MVPFSIKKVKINIDFLNRICVTVRVPGLCRKGIILMSVKIFQFPWGHVALSDNLRRTERKIIAREYKLIGAEEIVGGAR